MKTIKKNANPYLDTRWHGYVKIAQYMLGVLILCAFPQERQKTSSFFVAVSDLASIR